MYFLNFGFEGSGGCSLAAPRPWVRHCLTASSVSYLTTLSVAITVQRP
jgi:hypothetical protein